MKYLLISFLIELIYSQCLNCDISYCLQSYCQQCNVGYVLYNGFCYECQDICQSCTNSLCDQCNPGYYGDQTHCYNCSSQCLTCTSAALCTHCQDHYFISSGYCSICNFLCKTCEGASNYCLSCYDGYLLVNNECIKCDQPCDYCLGQLDICTTCITQYYISGSYCLLCEYPCFTCSSITSCSTCFDGYYLNQSNQCIQCSGTCQTCLSDSQCQQCIDNTYYLNPSDKKCLDCSSFDKNCLFCKVYQICQQCVSGYFIEVISSGGYQQSALCQPCSSQCSSCSKGKGECLTCQLANYIPPFCIDSCNSNEFLSGQQCLQCDIQCDRCSISAPNCLTCAQNRAAPPSCNCILGYFDNSGYCYSCGVNCEHCINSGQCLRCAQPYYVQSGGCVQQCDSGYYLRDDFNCILCDISHCYQCNTYGQCVSCNTNYLLYQNQCFYQLCGDGKYTNDNLQCLNCDVNCYNCINQQDNCVQCITGSYLLIINTIGKCINECPLHYYSDGNNQCLICSANCQECSTEQQCISCKAGQYLLNQRCFDSCPDTYYQIDQQCRPCPNHCISCYEYYCFTCQTGYFIDNDQCVSKCQPGYYFDNNQCFKCNSICKTCINNTQCTSCTSPFYLENNTCLGNCPISYYRDAVDNQCKQCIAGCEICQNPTFCYKCLQDYSSFKQKCVSECEVGYYVEDQYCRECHLDCYTCKGPTYYDCVKCKYGLYEYKSLCVAICPETTVLIDGQCIQCYGTCQTCSQSGQGNCLSCKADYIFLNNGCYAYCPSQYYRSNNICLQCQNHCDICINSLSCIRCLTNYFYDWKNCTSLCPLGYYGYDGICEKCHVSCKSCDGALAINCLSCTSPNVLDNNECLPGCPNLNFQTASYTCSTCLESCGMCNNNSQCTYCQYETYSYLNSQCVPQCIQGYMTNQVNRSCIPCYSGCSTCYGQNYNQCLTCFNAYYFYNNQCYSSCPSQTFGTADWRCIHCNQYCATCDLTSLCLTCLSGYSYYNQECSANCPDGYYSNSNVCTSCPFQCRKCSSDTQCTECYNHYTSAGNDFFLSSGSCVSSCPNLTNYFKFECYNSCRTVQLIGGIIQYCSGCSHTYFDITTDQCRQCHDNCLTCYGWDSNQCLTCTNLIKEHQCVTTCGDGYYQQGITCQQCHRSCKSCSTTNQIDNCLTCYNGSYLQLIASYIGRCVNHCDDQYYPDSQNKVNGQIICRSCSSDCSTCQINTRCETCTAGLAFYSGQCRTSCPSQYFLSSFDGVCYPCKGTCGSCHNPESCLTPVELYTQTMYLQDGQSYANCDDGYYVSGLNCIKCLPQCLRCTNGSTCSACNGNLYVSYNNQCLTKCLSRYFFISGVCDACDNSCLTCFDIYDSSCLSCSSDLNFLIKFDNNAQEYYSYCVTGCPATYTVDPIVNHCLSNVCDATCSTCLSNEPYYCVSCPTGNVLNIILSSQGYLPYGYCVSSCPVGKYLSNGECYKCNRLCTECVDNTNKCSQCSSFAYRIRDNECVTQCPTGYLLNSDNMTCDKCATDCLECIYHGGGNLCLVPANQQCSQYTYVKSNVCRACHETCLYCSGPTKYQCLGCTNLYTSTGQLEYRYYYYGQCVLFCPIGSVQDGSNCILCNGSCETCSTTSGYQQCLSCYIGKYLLFGQCVTNCGSNYYSNLDTQICDPCYTGCATCVGSGPDQCMLCSTGFYLSDNKCVPYCPYQYYFDINTGKCEFCNGYIADNQCYSECPLQYNQVNNVCNLCTNDCQSCKSGLYLYQHTCLSRCIDGTYPDTASNCQQCDIQCHTCSRQPDNCLTCSSTTRLSTPKCECKVGYQQDSITATCVTCATKCYSCINYFNNCTECKPDRIQNPPSCTCPYGTYDNNGVSCIACPFVCDDCLTATICLYCKGDRVGRNCLCRIGKYDDGVSNYCKNCDHSCTTCNQSGCLQCRGNRLMDMNHSCNCPIGYFEDNESYFCPMCSFKCQTCQTESNNCLVCRGNRTSQPLCTCEDGYFDDEVSDNCQQCRVECVTCTKASCLTCKTNRNGSICDCPPGGIDRQDVGIMFCETCDIGTPIIQMQIDLITLIVKFGKQVTFDTRQNCAPLFDQTLQQQLGIDPKCYVNELYQIVIILGIGNQIKIGQQIQLQLNIRGIDCDLPFPAILPTNILPPYQIENSDIIIFGPEEVSICDQVNFYVGQYIFDAKNGFTMKSWTLNSITPSDQLSSLKVNSILYEANSYHNTSVYIPAFVLAENITYNFRYEFINYLGVQQFKYYTVKCVSASLPTITIQYYDRQPLIYYLNNKITIRATLTQQTCDNIDQSENDIYYKYQITSQQQIIIDSNYQLKQSTLKYVDIIIKPYSLTSVGYYYLNIVATIDKQSVTKQSILLNMKSSGFYANIYGGNQMHYYANSFKLDAIVRDLDVEKQTESIVYAWSCWNIELSAQCVTANENILPLKQQSLSQLIPNKALQPYYSYKFTITAIKANKQVSAFIIVSLADIDVPALLLDAPNIAMNNNVLFNQELEFIIKHINNPILSGTILYDYQELQILKIPYSQFSFTLSEQLKIRYDSVLFRVLLFDPQYSMPSLASLTITTLQPALYCKFLVSPDQGLAYNTSFKLTVTNCVDQFNPLLYRFTYYYNQTQYENDIFNSQTIYSDLLIDYQINNMHSTMLPASSLAYSIIIATVKNSLGAELNFTSKVIVAETQDDLKIKKNMMVQEVKFHQIKTKYNRLLTEQSYYDVFYQYFNTSLTTKQADRISLLNVITIGIAQLFDSSNLKLALLSKLQSDSQLPLITKPTQAQIYKSISKLINSLTTSQIDFNILIINLQDETINSIQNIQQILYTISQSQASYRDYQNSRIEYASLFGFMDSSNGILGNLNNLFYDKYQGNISEVANLTLLTENYNNTMKLLGSIKTGLMLTRQVNGNPIIYKGNAFNLVLNSITSQKMTEYLQGVDITKSNKQTLDEIVLDENKKDLILNFSFTHYLTNPFILDPTFPNNSFFTSVQSIEPILPNGSILVPSQPATTRYTITKYRQARLLQQYQDLYYLDEQPEVVNYKCMNQYFDTWSSEFCQSSSEIDSKGELIIICDCNYLGPTSVNSFIGEVLQFDKFQKSFSQEALIALLNFPYHRSVIVYSLAICTAILILLIPYGFKKDQMEKDRVLPQHLIESEYIRKLYEDNKRVLEEKMKQRKQELIQWKQNHQEQELNQTARTGVDNVVVKKLNFNNGDQIQEIIISPDVDPDELMEEQQKSQEDSDSSLQSEDSDDSENENSMDNFPTMTIMQMPKSKFSPYAKYFNYKGKYSLNDTIVKKILLNESEEQENQVPVLNQQNKSALKERQSSRQQSDYLSVRNGDTLQQLIGSRTNGNGQIYDPYGIVEQPSSPKTNSMQFIENHDEVINSDNNAQTIQLGSNTKQDSHFEEIEVSPKKLTPQKKLALPITYHDYLVFEEDNTSLEEKEKIVQLWYVEQRRARLLQEGFRLQFTFKNLLIFISLFQQIFQVFHIFDKQLPRPVRFCLIYMTILSTCYINIFFQVELTPSKTIAYCILSSLLSLIELFILKFLMPNRFLLLRLLGWLAFIALTSIFIYLIIVSMALEAQQSEGDISRSNAWGINFIISFLTTHCIMDPLQLIVIFKFLQLSFHFGPSKLQNLFISICMNKHFNSYFDLLDQ